MRTWVCFLPSEGRCAAPHPGLGAARLGSAQLNASTIPGLWGACSSPPAWALSRLQGKKEGEGEASLMAGGFLQLELIMIMNSKSGCFPGSGCQGDKHHRQLVPRFRGQDGGQAGRPVWEVTSDRHLPGRRGVSPSATWGVSPSLSPALQTGRRDLGQASGGRGNFWLQSEL